MTANLTVLRRDERTTETTSGVEEAAEALRSSMKSGLQRNRGEGRIDQGDANSTRVVATHEAP